MNTVTMKITKFKRFLFKISGILTSCCMRTSLKNPLSKKKHLQGIYFTLVRITVADICYKYWNLFDIAYQV